MKNKMKNEIKKTTNGVKIFFTKDINKNKIEKMVENCSTGKCGCMNDTTKEKISKMKVNGKDGKVELILDGEITVQEIEKAISKSKII